MKKVFLEDLPKKGITKQTDWKRSEGHKVKFVYDNIKGFIKIIKYINYKNIIIEYDNERFPITLDSFIKCRLGRVLGKYTNEFKIELGQIFKDDKRDITIIDRKIEKDNKGHNKKYYKYKCNLCGFDSGKHWSIKNKKYKDELWIEESNLINSKQGCSCCCTSPGVVVENINSIYKTDTWMIPYIGEDCAKKHTHSSNDKVEVTCPDCGRVKNETINSIYNKHSIGCNCGDSISYPNKFAFRLLEQLNIKFENEKKFNWCKYLFKNKNRQGSYDFYIPSMNLIMEMDGGLGHGKNIHKLSNQTAVESKYIDDEKDRLAEEHGIEVIRVDCDYSNVEYIKNNILNNKKLNKLFNFSKIDWENIDKYSMSNLVKIACNYRQEGMKINKIALKMKLSERTINKYLKEGSKYGWCNYKKINRINKNIKKENIKHHKKVEIFKNGISLGIFPSCSYLERESERLFGIKLFNNSISKVCIGKCEQYKGYTFRYVDEDLKEVANF